MRVANTKRLVYLSSSAKWCDRYPKTTTVSLARAAFHRYVQSICFVSTSCSHRGKRQDLCIWRFCCISSFAVIHPVQAWPHSLLAVDLEALCAVHSIRADRNSHRIQAVAHTKSAHDMQVEHRNTAVLAVEHGDSMHAQDQEAVARNTTTVAVRCADHSNLVEQPWMTAVVYLKHLHCCWCCCSISLLSDCWQWLERRHGLRRTRKVWLVSVFCRQTTRINLWVVLLNEDLILCWADSDGLCCRFLSVQLNLVLVV
mmetsp:Transcript_34684/g.55682  ORF Transcript_34684/g.55682 Transcript_34684/m.55682 type:complete len:256 (-) Transcript_34684:968-1735(-)